MPKKPKEDVDALKKRIAELEGRVSDLEQNVDNLSNFKREQGEPAVDIVKHFHEKMREDFDKYLSKHGLVLPSNLN